MVIDLQGHIKLIDFGLSHFASSRSKPCLCGSLGYLSPEAIRKERCTSASDFYGLGAVLYELLTGHPPHYSMNSFKMQYAVMAKEARLPARLSRGCRDLLSGLLRRDPSKRLNIDRTLSHPWFAGIDWDSVMRRELRPPFRPDLCEPLAYVDTNQDDSFGEQKQKSENEMETEVSKVRVKAYDSLPEMTEALDWPGQGSGLDGARSARTMPT